jgi:phosphatidylserine/phosphatidylglycerophosphate/cardiolipin synthase-like enzyme
MVVDSKSLIVSTANFTMSGMHGDMLAPKTRGNANSLLRINSPSLAKTFTEEFFQMWGGKYGASRSKFGLQKEYRGLTSASVRNSKVSSQFSPTARRRGYDKSVNGTIAQTLSKAKKEVLISLFVFSDQNIANTLKDLQETNNKMEIGVLIERKFATRNYSELLDLWGIQLRDDNCNFEYKNFPWSTPLKSAGTPNLIDGDLLHHKFAVIDEETVIVGSQNWSDSANTINDENVLIIKDTHIAKLYKQEYKRINKYSQLGPSRTLLKKIELLEQSCTSTY